MPKDVIITPASGLIDFKDTSGNVDAFVQLDDSGNLNIRNAGGILSLGNPAANVYIGDGTNSIDVIFEQSGKIRGLTNKTLTLGQSDSFVNTASPFGFISPDATKTITARMLNSDVLSFQGGAGELFSISDSMSGTIFSVNDVSGIPSIEVLDTGLIKLAQYTSGVVGVGISSALVASSTKLQVQGSGNVTEIMLIKETFGGSNNRYFISFMNSAGTYIGSINTTGTGVQYSTGSDYRLKENLEPMTKALERNSLLKPYIGNWIADGSPFEGFVAHELKEVFNNAANGEKDAVDASGNPIYQSVSTGPLDAHFAACIEELNAKISELTARVAELEKQ